MPSSAFDRRRVLLALLAAGLLPLGWRAVGAAPSAEDARTLIEEVSAEVLAILSNQALANLASKLHLYRGQSFEVTGAKVVSDKDALVTSRILSDGEPPLQVDWRLRERDGARPVTIDLIVEGVSLIVTLRSEFASVIERQGFDGLLAELRLRIEQTRQA